ncbi:HAMP domain-containing sensor histidine kinase [Acuticoccus sp. MNP-M23]|uniref:sensor histidine kinase n=1 Tax=Acuticoccus sp. MNP-M23 TaxID=3072793 RepID=UPI0028158216|nr:HAMP domain-containing sensor histidine kinase [Acuticoccus sp. MNP-M23]WMS43892.1 HAMP domain-containing sensor histidine kinase [Acuticoccus sp. MNP-M23]
MLTPTFSVASRVALIVFAATIGVWMAALAVYYKANLPAEDPSQLAPARLAAIVALFETEPRERLAAALTTDSLKVELREVARPAAGPIEALTLPDGRAANRETIPPHSGLLPRLTKTHDGHIYRIPLSGGTILVLTTRSSEFLNGAQLPVGIGAGLIGTFIAVVALIVMHREMAPLRRLAEAADRLDLSGRSPPLPQSRSSAPEIRSLVAAFNRLQERLATLLAARMVMVAGISHDVRTFATKLRLRLELLPESETRERAVRDVIDIVRMLDDALVATRAGMGELAEELMVLAEIVEEEVTDRAHHGATATCTVAPAAADLTVLGDRLAIRRIVANLIDNAIKYGHAAHVAVTAPASGCLAVTVDDEGPGIDPRDRAMLVEPFVRLETSRNRSTGGSGLGLAIAKSLAEAHEGTLEIGDAPGGGARFTLTLPSFLVDDPSQDDGVTARPH